MLLVASAAGIAASVALAAQSPQALRKVIFGAAVKRHSLHYVSAELQGKSHVRIVGDVAATSGTQQLTFRTSSGAGHATVTVVQRTAYLRGDRLGLRDMGLPAAASKRYAGQWISIPHTSKLFPLVAEAVTFPSFLGDLFPVTQLSLVHRNGRVGLRGKSSIDGVAVVDTLFPQTSGDPLPAQEDEVGKGFVAHIAVTRWNEPVHVKAPARAVPISTVLGGGTTA